MLRLGNFDRYCICDSINHQNQFSAVELKTKWYLFNSIRFKTENNRLVNWFNQTVLWLTEGPQVNDPKVNPLVCD